MKAAAMVIIVFLLVGLLLVGCVSEQPTNIGQQEPPVASEAGEQLDQNPLDEALEELEMVDSS